MKESGLKMVQALLLVVIADLLRVKIDVKSGGRTADPGDSVLVSHALHSITSPLCSQLPNALKPLQNKDWNIFGSSSAIFGNTLEPIIVIVWSMLRMQFRHLENRKAGSQEVTR